MQSREKLKSLLSNAVIFYKCLIEASIEMKYEASSHVLFGPIVNAMLVMTQRHASIDALNGSVNVNMTVSM
jgi:hypothetical protein